MASWRERLKNHRGIKMAALAIAFMGVLLFANGKMWTPAWGQESPLPTPPPAMVPVLLPGISGVANNTDGEPLPGLIVTLYRRQLSNWQVARQATTDASGVYRFPRVPAGSYRLYLEDPQGIYASTYYPDAGDIENGADVILTGTSIEMAPAAINEGGQITGTLSWPDGPTPFDTTIDLYLVTSAPVTTRLTPDDDLSLPPELRQYRLVASETFTESVINYDFTGLAAGSYRVCAEVMALHKSYNECFDDASLGIHGTDVVVAVGATVADVEIEFGDGADLSTLAGNITTPDGAPAVGVEVDVIPAPNVDFAASPLPTTVTTDGAGVFRAEELPYGSYTLNFRAPNGLYLGRDYRSPEDASEPTAIALDRDDEVTIDAVLEAAGQITGHVLIDGVNAGMNGQVAAYYMGQEGWGNAGSGSIIAATGAYTVAGLPGRNYRLQVSVELPVAIYYGGSSLETAQEIEVVTGTTVGGIDIDLTPYFTALVYGSISGTVSAENGPQPGIQVFIFDAAYDCCIAPPPMITTETDGDGRFAVGGIPPGRYKIGIALPDQPNVALYAPDRRAYETAEIYVIGNPADQVSRQVIDNVNVTLGATGSVSRTVHRSDDTPVVGTKVNLYQRLGDPGAFPLVASTLTNEEGQYNFAGLVPDIYHVCIVAENIAQPSCTGRGEPGMGFDVVVTAGQEATGIDILP